MTSTRYRLPEWLGGHPVEIMGTVGTRSMVFVESGTGAAANLEIDSDHLVEVEPPLPPEPDSNYIWIAPGRHAGAPCIPGTRIPVDTVVRAVWGGSVELATESYECTREQALVACWYQVRYGKPPWRKRWGSWADKHESDLWAGRWNQVSDPPTGVPASAPSPSNTQEDQS